MYWKYFSPYLTIVFILFYFNLHVLYRALIAMSKITVFPNIFTIRETIREQLGKELLIQSLQLTK